jgi:colicin import membrane protein
MSESVRDRWLSIGMSVLLHGSLIILLAFGFWHFRHPAPAPTLPINATVVDARTLKGAGAASSPAPKPEQTPPPQPAQSVPPPTAQPEGPPPPTPDELAMRQQAAKAEAEHEAQAQKELLARQQAEQAREREAEQAAAQQAAEAKQAEEAAAAAQARKTAEAKRLAEARKKAAAKLAAQKKLAQERKVAEEKQLEAERERAAAAERAARVADLQRSLQEDERAAAASGALASWQSEITSRIQNAWIKPPTARPGIKCVLNVGLVPGGSVTGVSIGECNGDDAVRQSIQTAVYNASPLPPPPNGIPFPRQLIITFQPTN